MEKLLTPGLVTVTFRKFDRRKIVQLAKDASLNALEWGGDVHVKPDDKAAADEAKQLCSESGTDIAAYGSYYRCDGNAEFMKANVRQAAYIGAKTIRVWSGSKGSADAAETRADTIANLRAVCDEAAKYGLTVSTECHYGTLNDDCDSALRMLDEVGKDNMRLYWQPNQWRSEEYNLDCLKRSIKYVTNIHVFTWDGDNHYPLSDGDRIWRKYIDIINSDGNRHGMFLEFIYDDTETQFMKDAETLHSWID